MTMENDKSIITTTDIINIVDKNNKIEIIKIKKTYKKGMIIREQFLNDKDELHREEGPADIYYINNKTHLSVWYKNGKLHRDGDLPAYIKYFTTGNVYIKQWFQNDKSHRDEDKPAIISYDKEGNIMSEEWYQNDKLHRPIENGPAWIGYNNDGSIKEEQYYLDDKLVEKIK
jgi:antitoxin component YwqK of YwqJK toxin-antitoxin module